MLFDFLVLMLQVQFYVFFWGGGAIRNGVRNPERGEGVGGWRCFFMTFFENVRVGEK